MTLLTFPELISSRGIGIRIIASCTAVARRRTGRKIRRGGGTCVALMTCTAFMKAPSFLRNENKVERIFFRKENFVRKQPDEKVRHKKNINRNPNIFMFNKIKKESKSCHCDHKSLNISHAHKKGIQFMGFNFLIFFKSFRIHFLRISLSHNAIDNALSDHGKAKPQSDTIKRKANQRISLTQRNQSDEGGQNKRCNGNTPSIKEMRYLFMLRDGLFSFSFGGFFSRHFLSLFLWFPLQIISKASKSEAVNCLKQFFLILYGDIA